MTITTADEIDDLTWIRATDQYGTVDNDGESVLTRITDTTVETLNGTTYIVSTTQNGDIWLHTYDETTMQMTQIGFMDASMAGGTIHTRELYTPTLSLADDGTTLIITAESDTASTFGFTYDTTRVLTPGESSGADPIPGDSIEFHPEFTDGGRNTDFDEAGLFVINGTEYYINITQTGGMNAGTIGYDSATGQLTYNEIFQPDVSQFATQDYLNLHNLVEDDFLRINNISNAAAVDVTFVDYETISDPALGDVVYAYAATTEGLVVSKYYEDPDTNEFIGTQVVYDDGTTTKDLFDAGITNGNPYPATNPLNPASTLIDTNTYLNTLSGLAMTGGDNTGATDALDMEYLRSVESFTVGGKTYVFVGTWSGNEDGAALFEVDRATGLPTTFVDWVEMDIGAGLDPDDVQGAFASDFTDVETTLAPDGTVIIAATTSSGVLYFGFDPNDTTQGNQDGAGNQTGALQYLGAEGGSDAYITDSSGPEFLGTAGTGQGFVNAIAILPDGSYLVSDQRGYWLADVADPPICFMSGTLIETLDGECAVEDLEQNDLVRTKDNGFQPIRWIGKKTYRFGSNNEENSLRPVRIRAGALGDGLPAQDLYVSPQHRILVKSRIAACVTGSDEVLVPAKKLLDITGIDLAADCDEVIYMHILFDQHEIVYANGAEAESLYTGPEALKAVDNAARHEILEIFPELAEMDYCPEPVRIIPKGCHVKNIVTRHVKNDRAIISMQ